MPRADPGNPGAQRIGGLRHERGRSLCRTVALGPRFPARFGFQARPAVGAGFCRRARKVKSFLETTMKELWAAVDRYFGDQLAPQDEALKASIESNREAGMPSIDVPALLGK